MATSLPPSIGQKLGETTISPYHAAARLTANADKVFIAAFLSFSFARNHIFSVRFIQLPISHFPLQFYNTLNGLMYLP